MTDTAAHLTKKTPTPKQRVLTGITTSGIPHLGNYVGAIRPAIASINNQSEQDSDAFFFLADLHALIKCQDPKIVHASTKIIAATWIACGLDPERVIFYRQSDVPAISELSWILSCSCSKGLMNRAHAYKDARQKNRQANITVDNDGHPDAAYHALDDGISMGLFGYPILMAADILLFNATHVPVGRDQKQHLEMARAMASSFNHTYCQNTPIFIEPMAVIDDDVPLLTGLDGRKMSKSYGNTIALFSDENGQVSTEKALKKSVFKIVTNSKLPGEPKSSDESALFEIYKAFATPKQTQDFCNQLQQGLGWGDAKQIVFETINAELSPMRERFNALMDNPVELEAILQKGAQKANSYAKKQLQKVHKACGIKPLAKLK